MKAVIPAAGLGTRFLPASKNLPKELMPVFNKPVLQYVVEEALAPEGVDEVIVVNSHAKPQIEAYFEKDEALVAHLHAKGKNGLAALVEEASDLPVSFCYQDEALGLGHAVLQAKQQVGTDAFFVLLGDYFVPNKQMCKDMAAVSKAHGGASVIAVAPCPPADVSRYGIIGGEVVGSLTGEYKDDNNPGCVLKVNELVEKPSSDAAPSNLFIVGRYLLDPFIMELLETQETGAGGEIQLTDAMVRLLETHEMYALVVDPTSGCDAGTPETLAASSVRMVLEHPELVDGFFEALGTDSLTK